MKLSRRDTMRAAGAAAAVAAVPGWGINLSRRGGDYRLRYRGRDLDLSVPRGGSRRVRLDRSGRLVAV